MLGEPQLATLKAVCDTVVPEIERDRDPDGFWARKASDTGADLALAERIGSAPPEQLAGIAQLLDGLSAKGFGTADQTAREQMLAAFAGSSPEAAAGISALVSGSLFFTYSLPDPETGQNPFWKTFGYPGPIAAEPAPEERIPLVVPERDSESYEADAVVVGSGAGGGVIAARLAAAGLSVVVVEEGQYQEGSDLQMLELLAYRDLFYRGGPAPTADGNVSVQAGSSLGGGTTINWTNCLRTTPWVREQWAGEHGLEGLDGPEFDRHLDAVTARIGATQECSDFNGPTLRLKEGAEKLGWEFSRVFRNTDPSRYSPETAGYLGFGDRTGSKQSTTRTFLRDAADAGTRILANTGAREIITESGRAAGIKAIYRDPVTGRSSDVTIRAPKVVVAGGSLESPALLLRSGIGGPAVGTNLHLHPCTAMIAIYEEDQRSWWGAPHTGVVEEFANTGDGWGFLIETAQYTTGVGSSAYPFNNALDHKSLMERFRFCSTSIALLRDRGSGRVTIDANGESVATYSITDETDIKNAQLGLEAQAAIHEAARAVELRSLAPGLAPWKRGDDLSAFISSTLAPQLAAGGQLLFSAHQMGTCPMGTDPATSVAGPRGELHDTPGVWIGDGSAFPSASGTNPMITIMALADRTADAIIAS